MITLLDYIKYGIGVSVGTFLLLEILTVPVDFQLELNIRLNQEEEEDIIDYFEDVEVDDLRKYLNSYDRQTFDSLCRCWVEADDEECVICLDKFASEDMILKTGCNHTFHRSCIYEWFKDKLECPCCREAVTYESLVKKG